MEDEPPNRPGRNPHGGGGNQFMYPFVVTQGDFGVHTTVKGKIVYRRPRHFFSQADLWRILPKVSEQEEKIDKEFTWWQKLMNWVAEYMIDKIFAFASLDDELTKMFWSAVNIFYLKFLVKITGNDPFIDTTMAAYKLRMEQAVEAYTQRGDHSLLEAILKDIQGG